MLCDICQQNEAVIHYSEMINGIKKEKHLCSNCAKTHMEKIFSANGGQGAIPMEFFFPGLAAQIKEKSDEDDYIVCEGCGTTLGQFKKNGKFGCAKCYETFADLLPDTFKRIQGASFHVGKRPQGAEAFDPSSITSEEPLEDLHSKILKEALSEASEQLMPGPEGKKKRHKEKEYDEAEGTDTRVFINTLKKELKEAVEAEDYENAAHLRDKIKKLEDGSGEKPAPAKKRKSKKDSAEKA